MICEPEENKAEALVWAIEDVSGLFGLRLNKAKCQQISIRYKNNTDTTRKIRFKDLTFLETADSTIYLGSNINERVNPRAEINRRIHQMAYITKSLKKYWRKARINKRQKILQYEAFVGTTVICTRNTTNPRDHVQKDRRSIFQRTKTNHEHGHHIWPNAEQHTENKHKQRTMHTDRNNTE